MNKTTRWLVGTAGTLLLLFGLLCLNYTKMGSAERDQPTQQVAMNYKITVIRGLSAYYLQPSGQSRPGVEWAIQIAGDSTCTVLVRTYFSSDPPQDEEQTALAAMALSFVRKKIDDGWVPQPETFLVVE